MTIVLNLLIAIALAYPAIRSLSIYIVRRDLIKLALRLADEAKAAGVENDSAIKRSSVGLVALAGDVGEISYWTLVLRHISPYESPMVASVNSLDSSDPRAQKLINQVFEDAYIRLVKFAFDESVTGLLAKWSRAGRSRKRGYRQCKRTIQAARRSSGGFVSLMGNLFGPAIVKPLSGAESMRS